MKMKTVYPDEPAKNEQEWADHLSAQRLATEVAKIAMTDAVIGEVKNIMESIAYEKIKNEPIASAQLLMRKYNEAYERAKGN